MSDSLVQIRKVSFSHKDNQVLNNVNLDINSSEFVYLIGKTGSGKSSLLKLLYADLELKTGDISVGDFNLKKIKRRKIAGLRRTLGIIFQDFQLLPDRTVFQNLEFAMKATGWKKKDEIKNKITEILKQVQLSDMEDKYPHQLSGGEQQRVSIGRALINSPKLILADEPTGNLDPDTTNDIMQLLTEIKNAGTTVIMATHDYTIIKNFPGRVVRCVNGVLNEEIN